MMKAIKTRLIIYAAYTAVGVFLMFLPPLAELAGRGFGGSSGFVSGIGGALAIIGAVRVFQYKRIARDPDRAQEWNNAMREERTVFIANKARAWTFYISVFAELAAGLIAMFAFRQELLGMAFMYIVCFQCLLSFILYRVFNRKY